MDKLDVLAVAEVRRINSYTKEDVSNEAIYQIYKSSVTFAIIRVRCAWRIFLAELFKVEL